jgi:hypothetical protein
VGPEKGRISKSECRITGEVLSHLFSTCIVG